VNLPAAGLGGLPAGQFALTLFNSSLTRLVNLELSALEADGRGKIISSPRVVTADKVKAIIEQGTEITYQEATSSGATSVSFRKAVLKLEVTPQIPQGAIFLMLARDSRGQRRYRAPRSTRRTFKPRCWSKTVARSFWGASTSSRTVRP
jgi:type IV pilus assembly protein PilQ